MRVLYIAHDIRSRVGGIQRFNQRVLRCLSDIQAAGEIRCSVVALRDGSFDVGEGHGAIHVRGFHGSKLKAMSGTISRVLCGGFDLLLLDHVILSPVAALSKLRMPRSSCMMFVHGIEVWDDPAYRRATRLEKLCTRRFVDRIGSVSEFTAGRMQKAFAMPRERFAILPNAIDVPESSDGQVTAARRCANRIITVARLDEWEKGVGQVIRAMPLVRARIAGAEYVVVGSGMIRAELEKLAGECGVTPSVRFAGRVSDEELSRLYASSAVFAMPSSKEGFGIVYLEAWRYGLPVVAGNRDASPEVVDDAVNGLIVDPTSPEAIAQALVRLLEDPGYAKQLGAAGDEKLRRKYSHACFHARLRRMLLGGAASCAEEERAPAAGHP